MDLGAIELKLRQALTAEPSGRAAVVEDLVASLLAAALGVSTRVTDGFVPLREEAGAVSYFAVGKVYMIADQSTLPVWLNLRFAGGSGVMSGTVRIGVASMDGSAPRPSKLESALLAYPHETVRTIRWAHAFERRSDGWVLQESVN